MAKNSRYGVRGEIGRTGLKQFGGRVSEEWLRKLQGDRAVKIYREMSENDDVVGPILFAIEMLLRRVEWRVEPFDAGLVHDDRAEFVDGCLDDMSATWETTLAEILSFLVYGWSSPEIVYKLRRGPSDDPRRRSRFRDGRVGWRKLAPRSQDTLDRWEFDDDGGIRGWWQTAEAGASIFLPIEKVLLFRTTTHKGNPEGRSILRRAFLPWYYKRRVTEAEAIGVERDLAGMPIVYAPPELFDEGATSEERAALEEYKNIVENVRNDEQAGLVLPSLYDERGNQLVKFELAGTGARRLIDTNAIVQRHNQGIARSALADFILLGHEKVGSFALASSKTELFSVAIGAWLDEVSSVFNRHAIPRLFALNGWDPSETPAMIPGDVETPDVEAFANAVALLVGAGHLTPGSEEDEDFWRAMLGLPKRSTVTPPPVVETDDGDPEDYETNEAEPDDPEELPDGDV